MAADFIVELNDEAEQGLRDERYEFAPGGIRDKKTKRMVQLFRPKGRLECDSQEPCVQMSIGVGMQESYRLMKSVDRVYDALQNNADLIWETNVVTYMNYNLSIRGFSELVRKIDVFQNMVEFNRLQDRKENYYKHYMNLKDLLSYLCQVEPEIPTYEISKTLSEIAAYINIVYEDYCLGKTEPDIALRILFSLITPFARCAEECHLLCQFRKKPTPPSYDEWIGLVERIKSSNMLRQDLRKIVYFKMPTCRTNEIETAARLPIKTIDFIRIEANDLRNFISLSGMSREEYLDFSKQVEEHYLMGKYKKGKVIDNRLDF